MDEDLKNNRKDDFNTYIKDVYQKANVVLRNYMDVFSTIRKNVKNENWGAKEVISYIEDMEYEHKDIRIYLKSIKEVGLPGIRCNNEYKNFLNGIYYILFCRYGIRDIHTLLGFINICRNIIVYDLSIQQQTILREANFILKSLELSWEIVCESYNKIKSDFKWLRHKMRNIINEYSQFVYIEKERKCLINSKKRYSWIDNKRIQVIKYRNDQ